MTKDQSKSSTGPFVYENWLAAKAGKPLQATFEYPLFTDAHIVGETISGLGPYQLLNTVPMTMAPILTPAIVLRVEYYSEFDVDLSVKKTEKTDIQRYHGGLLNDEIAALVSLCLGVRCQAGGYTRQFYPDDDPRGRPVAYEIDRDPILPIPRSRSRILPQVIGEHPLTLSDIIETLPQLSPDQVVALVRAARLYQDALWVAEAEPELSWIMLVSAVETAANYWRAAKESAADRLKASKPELELILREAGGDELVNRVAALISDSIGATKKFVDFALEFVPEPPEKRTIEAYQHSWDRPVMQESLRKIYGWRSRALHRGIPFPLPMCEPPHKFGDAYVERPVGFGTIALGAYWVAEDTPMLLHTFEYIVRNSLLKWWRSALREV